ncbi:MAG: exodeoxyribonuclease VII large subunit [Desulfovibrio sp.]|nr:exodeoxyribonuclease VII large subunit [Desulfovibrio sp.]
MTSEAIYSVSALTEVIRATLAQKLPFVWVRGEITNLSRPASGHIYFSLKDSQSQLQCVWFAGRQRGAGQGFNPLTGEVYDDATPACADLLKNGLDALCAGGISCYAGRGQYQLMVEYVQPAGAGQLAQAFERLKRKLSKAGYFAQERKRQLPSDPKRVALITSTHGAAIHDFLEIGQSRGTGATIRIYPVQVQGADAGAAIAAAINLANAQAWAQAIVLIRGGGSLEDLWAFNEEQVATAVFQSQLPVLAGIGHEIDFTLADMTADCRAATPTHAAQLLWPARDELWQRQDELELALEQAIRHIMAEKERRLTNLASAIGWLSPAGRLERNADRLTHLSERLDREIRQITQACEARFNAVASELRLAERRDLELRSTALDKLATALAGLNPQAPLRRGYALLANAGGLVVSVNQTVPGEEITAQLADGLLILQTVKARPTPENMAPAALKGEK